MGIVFVSDHHLLTAIRTTFATTIVVAAEEDFHLQQFFFLIIPGKVTVRSLELRDFLDRARERLGLLQLIQLASFPRTLILAPLWPSAFSRRFVRTRSESRFVCLGFRLSRRNT